MDGSLGDRLAVGDAARTELALLVADDEGSLRGSDSDVDTSR